ncbi:hypothetical protein IGB42_01094 [Andreprevotia sp. IGB-42]|nr:hypothetical protein IGB42_01094 [Andreprevotia sp. IGB-42]
MRAQRGLSLFGFMIISIVVILVAVLFMKASPAYVEYFSVKKAIDNVIRDQGGASPSSLRDAFVRQATISNIQAVKAEDLVIVQTGSLTKISVAYEQVVPLFANISLLFDFEYSKSSGSSSQ